MAKIGILLVGGGTAGHMYPLLSVAKKLPENSDIRYFGDPGDFRADFEANNIRITKITTSKLRRYLSAKNILDVFKFFIGLFQSFIKVYLFMPDVVFSKGGPGALPIILAARFYKIPVVVHESDAVPGRTNRISFRFARIIDLGFDEAREYVKKSKTTVNFVGNPVREELLVSHNEDSARELFGLNNSLPVILILGGSQGAVAINDFILSHIEELLDKFQIIHQIGKRNYETYKNSYNLLSKNFSEVLKKRYRFYPNLGANIGDALDAAQVVVSRAGASSIAEIATKGKPAILIPITKAVVGEHQLKNAYIYSNTGAATVIEEENLLLSIFLSQVNHITGEPERAKKMSVSAKAFSKPDAAQKIADDILTLIETR
jgi:UDP-N-acetylglucosamine--N-acetylmuramyl-(pentapeptide) pyrophosphoryl-undecaprenol N-acetylglucosamine transferase